MADFNVGLGGLGGAGFLRADFNGPRKKISIGPRETVQETGDLPCSVPGTFFASGLVADNQLSLSRRRRKKVQTYLLPALDYSHRNP